MYMRMNLSTNLCARQAEHKADTEEARAALEDAIARAKTAETEIASLERALSEAMDQVEAAKRAEGDANDEVADQLKGLLTEVEQEKQELESRLVKQVCCWKVLPQDGQYRGIEDIEVTRVCFFGIVFFTRFRSK